MNNAKNQYAVVKSVIEHIQNKLSYEGKFESAFRIKQASIELLEVLADELNNPEIAKLWDDPILSDSYMKYDRNKNQTPLDKLHEDFDKKSHKMLNVLIGLGFGSYVIFTIIYIVINR